MEKKQKGAKSEDIVNSLLPYLLILKGNNRTTRPTPAE